MLLRILGDCGIANYSPLWWEEFPRWDELLLETAGHPYEPTFRRLSEHCGDRSHLRELNDIINSARIGYAEIRAWYEAPHPCDRIGMIPADLRWMIGLFLRIRIEMFNKVTTCILGDVESLDGEPAVIENNEQSLIMTWYRRGKVHRDGAPAYVRIGPTSLMCIWHQNNDCARIGSSILGFTGSTRTNSCQVMQMRHGRPDWAPTRDPAHLAEFAALRVEYWREVPGLIDFSSLGVGQSMTINIPRPRYDFLNV